MEVGRTTTIGEYEGVVAEFGPDSQSNGRGVHTFSITESKDGYVGYAGPVTHGPSDQ